MQHILGLSPDGGGSKCDANRIQSRNDSSNICLEKERDYRSGNSFKDSFGFYKVVDLGKD